MRVTEEETVYLITISKGRVVDLSFGPGWASLNADCKWAIDAVEERRREQLLAQNDLAAAAP